MGLKLLRMQRLKQCVIGLAIKDSYYVLGSALGPHPYPTIVRNFQRIIGIEVRKQLLEMIDELTDELVACVGGGSNYIGLFHPFYKICK